MNVTSPPTRSTRPSSASARGRSSTHCSARLLQTRSNAPAANGSARDVAADEVAARRGIGSPRRPRRAARAPTAARRAFALAAREHRQRDVERDLARLRIAQRELGLRVARAAAGIENRRGRELHDVEALGHPRADFPLQHGGAVVGRRGAREMAAHRARVDARRDRRRAALSGHRERRRAPRRTRRRATGTARAPRRRSARSARSAARSASQRPAAGQRQRVAIAGDDERRLRDRRRPRRAGRSCRSTSSAPTSAAGDGSPRAKSSPRSAASVARPCSLPCSCSVRKRSHRELPRDAQLVAEAGERLGRHRMRPVVARDEARRRRDERRGGSTRAGLRQRPAHRDQSAQRPAEHGERRASAANAAASAATTPSSVNGAGAALWPCPGRSTACTRKRRASRGDERSPHARMHRPAVQQHERRTRPDAIRRAARRSSTASCLAPGSPQSSRRASSASASTSASTSSRECAAVSVMRKSRRAVRHRRRTDRRHPEAALPQRRRRARPPPHCRRRRAAGSASASRSSVHGRARMRSRKRAISATRCARRARSSRDDREARAQRLGEQRRRRRREDVRARGLRRAFR